MRKTLIGIILQNIKKIVLSELFKIKFQIRKYSSNSQRGRLQLAAKMRRPQQLGHDPVVSLQERRHQQGCLLVTAAHCLPQRVIKVINL